jgi:hypothetical protein
VVPSSSPSSSSSSPLSSTASYDPSAVDVSPSISADDASGSCSSWLTRLATINLDSLICIKPWPAKYLYPAKREFRESIVHGSPVTGLYFQVKFYSSNESDAIEMLGVL